jgi:hypothetical protein
MMKWTRCVALLALVGVAACGGGASVPVAGLFSFSRAITTDNPVIGGGEAVVAMALGDVYGDGPTDVVVGYAQAYPGAAATNGLGPIPLSAWVSGATPVEQGIVIGDFLEDVFGNLDAIATVYGPTGGSLCVLDNEFELLPFFQSVPLVPLRHRPSRLVAGDWDGDGHLDVAVLEPLAAQVEILLGDGAGGFVSPLRTDTLPTGLAPLAIVAADLTGDGALDLAVTNGLAGTVSVFRNDDDGYFTLVGEFEATGGAQSLAAGDLDGDGILDLAVAGFPNDEVAILLGTGGGNLSAPSLVALSQDSGPVGIALADFDGDSDLDFVVALANENRVQVFQNQGGTADFSPFFPSKYGYMNLGQLLQVEAADMTGDGFPDIVLLVANVYNAVVILKNNL